MLPTEEKPESQIESDELYVDDREEPSELDTEALFLKLKGWYGTDLEHSLKWRKMAKECYDFAAGKQWNQEDRAALEDQGRPCITFNRIQSIIRAIAGIEINGRHETVYLPRGTLPGAVKANELLSACSQWMSDNCDAEDEQSTAFQDTIICGMGWTEATMSYDIDPDGAYDERRIDPLEMVWDRSARSKNIADARRVFRVRKMSLNEAREMFPDEDDADLDAPWAETGITSSADIQVIEERRKKRSETNGPDKNDDVHIVHCQWYEKECFYRVADPMSGEILDLGEDEYKTLEARAQEAGIPIKAVKQHRRQYKQCFLGAKVLGEVLEGPCPKGYSWNCITGELDHNEGTFYGPTSLMLDPQRWANKWLSSTLHILNTTAKGGIIAEADAFKDQRQAQDTYAQPDAITWAAKGAISGGKIMQKPGAGVPNSYVQLMEFAISSIRDVTGVNLELLGMRDANQAGILEAQRKQAAMTILATLFDSLRRFRKQVGRVRLHYIQNYLSDGRLIRIAGEDGMQAVPLVRDQTAGEYEVIVDDAPTSPNAKQETWAVIQQVIPAFRDFLTPDSVVAILEYSPLPSKLVDAFKEMAAKANAPNPEAEKQKMLEIENAVATIAKTKAAADKDVASAEATRAKGLLDLANAGAQIAAQLQAAVGNMMTPEPWVGPTIEPSYAIDPTFDQSAMPPPLPQVPQMPMGPQPMGPQPQPELTLMNGGLPQ